MASEAKIVRIAKAVEAELAAGSFSQPITVDRTYRPTRELADLADLRATVVPRGIELSSGSRGSASDEYSVDIALRKKLAADGVEIFFTQVFRDNFFHADMHPGNIFVDIEDPDNPRYAAVDFGIVGTLEDGDRRYLAANFLAGLCFQ